MQNSTDITIGNLYAHNHKQTRYHTHNNQRCRLVVLLVSVQPTTMGWEGYILEAPYQRFIKQDWTLQLSVYMIGFGYTNAHHNSCIQDSSAHFCY